jgi:5'-3' exonuclease
VTTPARLHLIDGTFELYRAHFAKGPPRRAPDGTDVKATLGLLASLVALVEDAAEAVTHVAIAFDNPIRSFRNDLFAGYKSDDGVPPELRAQFDLAEEAARAAGVTVWSMREFEADDAIASAAARFGGGVEQVRILSPDKDFGQCLDGARVIQVDRIRSRILDEAHLRVRRGIAPASVPDWLALVGDDADGIPGLPGIGEATASALLGAYGHIEEIPARAADWRVTVRGAATIAERLAGARDEALLYRTLATLRRDAPVGESLDALRYEGVPADAFRALCARLGATQLASRPRRWAASPARAISV